MHVHTYITYVQYVCLNLAGYLLNGTIFVSDGFSSNDFLFPCDFLDYRRFSLEVFWGQSPLKSRISNREDLAVASTDILKCVCKELTC